MGNVRPLTPTLTYWIQYQALHRIHLLLFACNYLLLLKKLNFPKQIQLITIKWLQRNKLTHPVMHLGRCTVFPHIWWTQTSSMLNSSCLLCAWFEAWWLSTILGHEGFFCISIIFILLTPQNSESYKVWDSCMRGLLLIYYTLTCH